MADNGTAGAQGGAGTTNGGQAAGQGAGTGSYVVQQAGTAPAAGAQGGAGGGSGTGVESPRERRERGVSEIADRLIHKYGSAERALDVLAGDNFDLRDSNRTLSERVAQLPPAGAMVLVGPDVQAWNDYKALNLPPDKVKERLAEHERLLADSQRHQLGTLAEQAAAAAGYKNPALLGELLADKRLQLEMRDAVVVGKDGKSTPAKLPFVRKEGDTSGHWTALSEYVAAHHAAYVPALNTPLQGSGSGGQSGTQTAQGAAGTAAAATTTTPVTGAQGAQSNTVVFTEGQQNGGQQGGGVTDPVAARIAGMQKAAAAPNALRPAATT